VGVNPEPAFVNKIILHAAREMLVHRFHTYRIRTTNVEIDVEDENPLTQNMRQNQNHQLLNMLRLEEVADGTQNNQDEEVDEEAFNTNNHKF
jgi:hypothetical protein